MLFESYAVLAFTQYIGSVYILLLGAEICTSRLTCSLLDSGTWSATCQQQLNNGSLGSP